MRDSAARAIGRRRSEPNRWISSPVGARRGSGEGLRRPAPSAWPLRLRDFVRFGIGLSFLGGLNGADAASHAERDRPGLAPAGRAGDDAAGPAADPRDTGRWSKPNTSP